MPDMLSAAGRSGACRALTAGLILCVVVAACGGTAATHRRPRLSAPRLLSLSYGEFHPRGAPGSHLALRLRAVERGGQILETDFDAYSGAGATADSECGVGGHHNGQVETFYTPFTLRPGPQTVQITALGSACGSGRRTRSSTRTFQIYVRRADAPSREPLLVPPVTHPPR